ncbi:conserved hypothetical protein [Theileria orientalis strain Shintoku]|uniref:OST-HTH associated domain-containing protein n=1 Tax=Theileria orientalis strain Shintoku TaxID=869250 RepID=J4CCR3_THEOR|nr:conserved hypothetical protein [Theileria orientalis strain Shintoku]PVC50192.1 hypothetical protein MACL_00002461 [Theileria orientalis]BAM39842.1 conserved hypothetical protein [Theileria orientalis strain Shintoku]|eukprot:XP_009690143.1 conserved hypothetical protein [Theileria orientalis strain Shintoku]
MIETKCKNRPKGKTRESALEKTKLYYKSDKLRSSKGSEESDSSCCESISSTSTSYTVNNTNNQHGKEQKISKNINNKRRNEDYAVELSGDLNTIYGIVRDLYDQEILPTIHEIRRKLTKYENLAIDPQNLLKMCSKDSRYEIIKLDSTTKNANDIQNLWAVLIRDSPFKDFSCNVDEELLQLVSNYLILISSYRYSNVRESEGGECAVKRTASITEDNEDNHVCEKDVVNVPAEDIFKVGGRYLFAEHLKNNGPRRLSNLPLGKILKIVQRLTEIGVLVYRGNFLVPVVNSKSASNKFILNLTKSYNQNCLSKVRENFKSMLSGGAKVAMSSVPIVYKTRFGEDLKYGEMGYEKLSDFIKTEIPCCRIARKANQYIVYLPEDDEEEAQGAPAQSPGGQRIESQARLNMAHTTLLYPLKITRIKYA